MSDLVKMKDIVKIYPNGVKANKGVNFSVKQGEIHALVGENGAGKSTLVKILYGLEQPTEGEIFINGDQKKFNNPKDAMACGIGMVHQDFKLLEPFTVAENVVLGKEPIKNYLYDSQKAIEETAKLSEHYGLKVNCQDLIRNIPVGTRQRVEILKALYRGAKVLLLDEPTAVLTPQETEDLFSAIRQLVEQGVTVVFITHKLREVKEISDRVTVMRDGEWINTLETKDVDEEDLARMMVGREVLLKVNRPPVTRGDKVLEVKKLNYVNDLGVQIINDLSFNVCENEVLGFAGVEGNGQKELGEILTGLNQNASGELLIRGKNILNKRPGIIRSNKVSHIPEDRMKNGLARDVSLEENLIIDRVDSQPYSKGMVLNKKAIRENAKKLIREYDIRTPNSVVPMSALSGGNMQKVIVARECSSAPILFIAAQPTRGIDVGATEYIRQKLIEMRTDGTAVILISADLQEVMSLADRIIVIYEGRSMGVFQNSDELTENELGLYMLGTKRQPVAEMEKML